ncbi:MAG: hypothetical protein AB3X36_09575, partial [Leptothrix ochracea]
MTKTLTLQSFKLGTLALTLAMMSACGGGSENATSSAPSATASTALTVSDTKQGLSIHLPALSPATTTTTPSSQAVAWSTQQFSWNAQITSGVMSGQTYSGTLMLKGESLEDGSTEVEGRMVPVPTTQSLPPSTGSTVSAQHIRQDYRQAVNDLVDQWRSATDPRAAVQDFRQAFRQITEDYQAKLDTALRQQARSDSNRSGTLSVSGIINADGTLDLQLNGHGMKLHLTGQRDSSTGQLSGTFTGPGRQNSGTWQASSSDVSPAPAPSPAPTP